MSDEQEQQTERRTRRPAYKRGQLVQFSTGDQLDGVGVVTAGSDGGGHLSVRPLAAHDVSVDPQLVEPVVVDEV